MDNRYLATRFPGVLSLGVSTCDLFWPDPDGPLPTVRMENMRDGMQQAEARAFIEEAILEKKIGGDLAKRCQEVLDERTNRIRFIGDLDWAQLNVTLYQCAVEVAKARR